MASGRRKTLGLREDALRAVKAAISGANPEMLMKQKLRLNGSILRAGGKSFDLSSYRRVIVIGGGKASVGMVSGLARVMRKWITSGVVNAPRYERSRSPAAGIEFCPSTHPLPSQAGVDGVKRMLSLVGTTTKKDLIVCLISGGASSMMPLPVQGITLSDKSTITKLMLAGGACINEVNTVRRHLSSIKGGRLAETLSPATILTLILSDVIGNKLEDIGSGPTAPDPSTYADARRVVEKYRVWKKAPDSVRQVITDGLQGRLKETAKPGSKVFRRISNIIIGDNSAACKAAAESLRRDGYRVKSLTHRFQGEARLAGLFVSSILRTIDTGKSSLRRPAAFVMGGETTVAVKGKGKGGRNQELVLAASLGIDQMTRVLTASVGTDGVDGNSDAAGAFADGTSVQRAKSFGIDPEKFLKNNNSYNYFRKLGDLIRTGPTGTNVNDITIALAGMKRKAS